MTPSFLHPTHHPQALIADALARSTPVIVTFRHDQGWGVFKTRLLAVLEKSNEVVLEYPDGGETTIPELMPGQGVGIAFRKGHKKCIGDTWIHARCMHTSRSGQQIPAFTMICPTDLYELQRRLFYRVEIPRHNPVDVDVWNSEPTGAVSRDDVYQGAMIDLSAGGLSLRFPPDRAPRFEEDEELVCSFAPLPEESPIQITARVRYRNDSAGERRYGLQFIGADATPEGREQLERIARFVSFLQSREKRSRKT